MQSCKNVQISHSFVVGFLILFGRKGSL
uniref:Uncharacterized protein n=1 Tax=Arundo donax TaxID=35708 RepID=A0A0A8YLM5_ARUDO